MSARDFAYGFYQLDMRLARQPSGQAIVEELIGVTLLTGAFMLSLTISGICMLISMLRRKEQSKIIFPVDSSERDRQRRLEERIQAAGVAEKDTKTATQELKHMDALGARKFQMENDGRSTERQ